MSTEDVETAIVRVRKQDIEERGLQPLGQRKQSVSVVIELHGVDSLP
jgi:hypothetical protein